MSREEFLKQFTDLIRAAFEHEGQDYGELLVSVYTMMAGVDDIRADEYKALHEVFAEYAAKSRFAIDEDPFLLGSKQILAMRHFEKSGVWKLVRRKPKNDWPDEL